MGGKKMSAIFLYGYWMATAVITASTEAEAPWMASAGKSGYISTESSAPPTPPIR